MWHRISLLLILALPAGCAAPSHSSGDASPRDVADVFMAQVFRHDRDLFTDTSFKKQYISVRLRDLIDKGLKDAATYTPPAGEPWVGHPAQQDRFNRTILNAWDVPTSYSVGDASVDGDVASVPVTYLWGPGTQYEGDKRITTVMLVNEAEGWRVDDLVTSKGEFVTAGSLSKTLQNQEENKP